MYVVFPQMQKIVLCGTEKINLIEQILTDYEEKIDNLNRKSEEFENKIKDMDLKLQDFNIADLLKSNTLNIEGGEGEEGGNQLILNLVSNLEKKFNAKSKTTDDRLNKLEETNYRLVRDTQNLKNFQDGTKRSINNLKKADEEIIENMKLIQNKIVEISPDMSKQFDSLKIPQKEKKEKEEKDESSKVEEKERKNSNLSVSKTEPQIDLENNEKIKEIMKRLFDIEKSVKILPKEIGAEQIKSDISALKSGIGNCARLQDLKEAKEKEDDMQKQINFLKEQFDDFTSNTTDHEDLQNVKRKLEFLNSKTHEWETTQQELLIKFNQTTKANSQFTGSDKYLEVQKFEDFKVQIIKEFSSVNDNFTHLRRLVDNILEALKNKPSYRDIKALEEELTVKFEELKLATTKKFAEKIETTKNFKYLDHQIKHILEVYIKRENKSENWLIAKKSLNPNLCASCESYIGDLKDNNDYQPWNKYPLKDPNDKGYRFGNGFSKMLQMIQVDENEKKNTGMVTLQNTNEPNKKKLEKIDGNTKSGFNSGYIKTENNKILPKIKANNTANNFGKNINNIGNRNMAENNFKQENYGEQIDINDGAEEEEDEKPAITKIVKVHKD